MPNNGEFPDGAVVFHLEASRVLPLLPTLRTKLPPRTLQIYGLVARICAEEGHSDEALERLRSWRAALANFGVITAAEANAYISDVEGALGYPTTPRTSEHDA